MSTRRDFIKTSAVLSAGSVALLNASGALAAARQDEPYHISLAEWSFHRAIFAGEMDHLDFPGAARRYGIGAVEYVNQFFKDRANDTAYLDQMQERCDANGVQSLLIMVDGEGALGHPDDGERMQAVENHKKWVDAASYLNCHSIRVNAQSDSNASYDEQMQLAADGLRTLAEYADQAGINVIVENHGGLSSNGAWLAGVMQMADHPRVGTLPDFGNFRISEGVWYDRYKGVEELMPYARSVSAKSHDFDETGNEAYTDYYRMMRIVLDAGYRGFVGIEYEGGNLSEEQGVGATNNLLVRVREVLRDEYAAG